MLLRLARTLTLSLPFGLMAAAPLIAQTTPDAPRLDFRFEPPKTRFEPICTARPPDEQTIAFWQDWDGQALPASMDSALIKRDINRLLHIDGARFYELTSRMIDRLEVRDPSFRGQNALLSRISAMEKAGRYEQLKKAQLVPELAAYGEALAPRARTALAHYYGDGIGIARDQDAANALLVSAGFAGNADALLRLSKMVLDGTAPAEWDVPLELAVSMAFGSLVGELNPTICDRTSRIAREYHTGDIVEKSPALAQDWFRFTADLGDAYAAWKVVEYHLEAEGIEKDNAVLLHYLQQAADAGLPYAQIELGRLYEVGALVEKDLDRALALYEGAASIGERPGLTRVALFLERYATEYPHLAGRRVEMLEALTMLEDPPGWAFTRLSQVVLERDGRWGGAAEAQQLLERAAALGDLDGLVSLAHLLLADAKDPADFDRAINLLARAVSVNGGVTPLKSLFSAYNCQAPDAPRIQEARHWASLEDATATANMHLSAREVIALNPQDTPLQLAVLQSHALYGRPTALASWLKLLENAAFADDDLRAFWTEYSGRYDLVVNALVKLELELAESREQRLAAFGLLREEYKRSGPTAALALAEALLDSRSVTDPLRAAEAEAEARAILVEIAAMGNGKAIQLLAGFADDDAGRRAVYDTYAEVIAQDGDFTAMLFAAPYVEGAKRAQVLRRARGTMSCDYKNAMLLAGVMKQIGDRAGVAHWLDVSETLMDDNSWAITDLARARFDLEGKDAATRAAEMFAKAYALGDDTAGRELFDLRVDITLPTYDPQAGVEMMRDALASDQVPLLAGYLGRYRKAGPETREIIEAALDMPVVLEKAALAGDVFSMRSLGQYLVANATGPADLTSGADWLRQAAEWGDATAMAEYGQALAFGLGVTPDPERAVYWLERATDEGSRKAAEITRLIRLSRGG